VLVLKTGGGADTLSVIGTITSCEENGTVKWSEVVYVPGDRFVNEGLIESGILIGAVPMLIQPVLSQFGGVESQVIIAPAVIEAPMTNV
jgi:hypothetical protein